MINLDINMNGEQDENEDSQAISPAKGMKLGMLVMNFLRQLSKT